MSVPAKTNVSSITEAMESTLVQGDLSKLSAQDRIIYYNKVCSSLGLNPLTQPFEYINLNGKLKLYAKRDCADQLRKINSISIEILSQDIADSLLSIHVRATDGNGKKDEDLGVVSFPDSLKGEARANAILKAVTKAKRRVTLSICGLGFLDETEVEDIPQQQRSIEATRQPEIATPEPKAKPKINVKEDPESARKWIVDKLKTFSSVEDMASWWNDNIAPRSDEFFPPDWADLHEEYKRAALKLAP